MRQVIFQKALLQRYGPAVLFSAVLSSETHQAPVDELPVVWQDVRSQASVRDQQAEILLAGLLPSGTPLYDLVVDEDHSFVIEGLVSHNTNCRCAWDVKPVQRRGITVGWHCTWLLRPAEHCTAPGEFVKSKIDGTMIPHGCLERAALWNPLTLWLPGYGPTGQRAAKALPEALFDFAVATTPAGQAALEAMLEEAMVR
jgi:hypothetical protein